MPTLPGFKQTRGGAYSAKSVVPKRVASDPASTGALCVCGCGRPRPPIAVKHDDPFASGECCRAYYGVVR